jgi:hypothetical protein
VHAGCTRRGFIIGNLSDGDQLSHRGATVKVKNMKHQVDADNMKKLLEKQNNEIKITESDIERGITK